MKSENKLYDAVIGLAVGDALGVPFEFKQRGTFYVTDMLGYGTHNQPVGTWSDDTSMTLATLESIKRLGSIDLDDIMQNFVKWYKNGDFTPYGKVFDIGNTTHKAIKRYMNGVPVNECGGRGVCDNGNGSLMRILPLAFIPNVGTGDVYQVSALTHAHEIACEACNVYVLLAVKLINGASKEEIAQEFTEFNGNNDIRFWPEYQIRGTGFVTDSLRAGMWCFFKTETYKDCVIKAVELGEDTDTTAAIAGGLAGIYYGVGGKKGIPYKWIAKIARRAYIEELCKID